MRLHFQLGACAVLGGLVWLTIPTVLFASMRDPEQTWQWVLTILGGLLLVPLLCWMPFLQTRFAAENRFQALFEVRAVRELFRQAPLRWVLAWRPSAALH